MDILDNPIFHRYWALTLAFVIWVLGFWLLDGGYLKTMPTQQTIAVLFWSFLSAWIATRW